MKITCLRARRLEIAVSVYNPKRGSRSAYLAREDSRSRTRRVESGHLVFGKGTVSLFQPYYIWEFRGFLCLAFFVVSLFCNYNKIL